MKFFIVISIRSIVKDFDFTVVPQVSQVRHGVCVHECVRARVCSYIRAYLRAWFPACVPACEMRAQVCD